MVRCGFAFVKVVSNVKFEFLSFALQWSFHSSIGHQSFWFSKFRAAIKSAIRFLKPEAVKETVATLLARCYTRIVIEQTRSPVARFSAAGFSLLELFLVVVIIFILFTLFLSSGSKSYQEKKLTECQGHLQNIYAALRTFSQDNNGALPAVPGAQTSEAPLSLLVPKYTTGSEFFICPGGKDKPLPDA